MGLFFQVADFESWADNMRKQAAYRRQWIQKEQKGGIEMMAPRGA